MKICVYAQTDGSILASGSSSTILIEAESLEEIRNSSEYQTIVLAYENEIDRGRVRSVSKYDVRMQ
ncbi:hypothetical protein [Methanolapillus millepedarum]|uniref:Uncharacterized protein n=1 Tax=Methanolapillus millepedarum TaxID=3028296 RepID=A0AA96ZUM5_9EURY|nr:hypothetical protein MsAc7_14750 [Methanosarcinaceae archaeon Ac7]